MKVLITGSDGFIAKNLQVKLNELGKYTVLEFNKSHTLFQLKDLILQSDFIFHLAGVNRPQNVKEFDQGNSELTAVICNTLQEHDKKVPLVLSSSIQAELENDYGISKKKAEEHVLQLNKLNNNPVAIYRLPNVFGKWSKPNYNSAIATFCYNIANDLPIQINNADAILKLVYVDDVVDSFVALLEDRELLTSFRCINQEYSSTVGEIASILYGFKDSIQSGITLPVGVGFIRALYSTYLSFLPTKKFSYPLVKHEDSRGMFVEMLKTSDSGQFSFFTAHPGITRGGHYHHTKTEKFLVIKGTALYRFRQIITREYYELKVSAESPTIVETIPGWSHDITNIGDDELVVMLWANEIFDRNKPDTINFKVA